MDSVEDLNNTHNDNKSLERPLGESRVWGLVRRTVVSDACRVLIVISLGSLLLGVVMKYLMMPEDAQAYEVISNWMRNWLELTFSGITMGLLVFMLAIGMTLVFGLMGVFNLAHGAFIALGTFLCWHVIFRIHMETNVTKTVLWSPMPGKVPAIERTFVETHGFLYDGNWMTTVLLIVIGLIVATFAMGVIAILYERFIVRRVYSNPTTQILMTLGGAVILIEIILLFYGGATPRIFKPDFLQGKLFLVESWGGGVGVDNSRLFAGGIGLVIYFLMHWMLSKTRFGLLVRAGVDDRSMVEVMGYRIGINFIGVFVLANVLATIGGSLYAVNSGSVSVSIADDLLLVVMVAIMVGGPGSVKGCLFGSIILMLSQNYMNGLYTPLGGEFTSVILLLVILLWRPKGLVPLGGGNQ